MNVNVAILWEQGQPLSVEEAELTAPGPGEVLVEIKAAGVCHSDLHPARGDWRTRTPLALGHEGAGIVCGLGDGVESVHVGDHVVLCWAPPCGVCVSCKLGRPVLCDRLERTTFRNRLPSGGTRLRARNQDILHFNSTACFADFAVVSEQGIVKVPPHIPFSSLATLGCAVITGMGAVTNVAKLSGRERIVVVGAGGVGLNVVQGAKIAGCDEIIAVDAKPNPLQLANKFGATHTIDSSTQDVSDIVLQLTEGRGADFVFDTVGAPATVEQSFNLARKGGSVIVTGLERTDSLASIPIFPLVMQEKRFIGSVYGSGDPLKDINKLVKLYELGVLKLEELVARDYRLVQVNEALSALAAGEGARGIILW
jgi:S-(hydroxymethyl)glutathione dehydrogenase / alcohol dehydrogenase